MNRVGRTLAMVFGTLALFAAGLAWIAVAHGPLFFMQARWTQWWFFLLAIPIPWVLYRMTLGADARTPRLAVPTLSPLVRGPRGIRTKLRDLPGILRTAGLLLAVLALARPENILRGEAAEERGIDIVIVLDLSLSMKAIMEGDAPQQGARPDPARRGKRARRIDTAKDVIVDFVSRRKTDRIGVVVFGRSAFILSPPTLDYALLTHLVSKIALGDVDGAGTAIGDAVGTAVARLRRSTAKSKAVILLTDGESNAGTIAPEYASHLAQAQGVRVYTVQIGDGDDVWVEADRTDVFGQPQYIRQRFPVNPELLKKISAETGGDSFVATDRAALEQSMHTILDRLEKTRFVAQAATVEQLFPFLLIPAVLLFVGEALVRLLIVRRFP